MKNKKILRFAVITALLFCTAGCVAVPNGSPATTVNGSSFYTESNAVTTSESTPSSILDIVPGRPNEESSSNDQTNEIEKTDESEIIVTTEAEKTKNKFGIAVAKISFGQQRKWNSTGTFHSTPFTLRLDFIDPETGEVNNFKTFSSMETYSCSAGFYGMFGIVGISNNTSVSRKYFNSDFTKMIATLTMEDGAIHIGWIDENGKFTDASAKISHSSEFGGIINHKNPCFFDDYLYFMDFTNNNVQIKRVPISSLSELSVEVLVDDVKWKGLGVYPYPDGTVVDSEKAMQEFSDASLTYVANSSIFNDWISTSEFVGTDNGMIYKYILSPKDTYSSYLKWYDEKIALVPEIKGRTNWGAVVSPDGKRVAFLSKLTGGTDTSTSLFIVSVDGGEPTKVNTTYDLNNSNDYTSNVALLDWK